MNATNLNGEQKQQRDTLRTVTHFSRAWFRGGLLLIAIVALITGCDAANGLIGIHSAFLPGNNQVPAPTVTATADAVATGGTVVLSATGSGAGAAYAWSVSSGTGAVDSTGDSVTFTAPDAADTAVVDVVASLGGFQDSDPVSTSILVGDLPAISFDDGTDIVFVDDTVNLSASGGGTGATYTWEVITGGGSIGASGSTVAFTAPATEGTATVRVTAATSGFSDTLQSEQSVTIRDNHFALLGFTNTGTNVNQTTTISWSSISLDSAYFDNSTPTQLEVLQDGDYFIALTMPFYDTGGVQRPAPIAQIYVNGGAVTGAIADSGYMRRGTAAEHDESSNHLAILLDGLSAGDTIEVRMTAGAIAGVVNVSDAGAPPPGQATLYAEFVDSTRTVFAGTANSTSAGTNLNLVGSSPLIWTGQRSDPGFTHSGGDITLDEAGYYLVHATLPTVMGGASTVRFSIEMHVNLGGSPVDGGYAKQGYIRNQTFHDSGSIHWSGIVYNPTPGADLTVSAGREASMSTTTVVNVNGVASVFVEKLDSAAFVYSGRARDPSTGVDWNSPAALEIDWSEGDAVVDPATYQHSTSTNPETITIQRSGDYLVMYNDVLYATGAEIRMNPRIVLQVDGSPVPGAITKTHYIRNDAADGHTGSSASLVFYLEGLTAGQTLSLTTQQESLTGEVRSADDALLTVVRKK